MTDTPLVKSKQKPVAAVIAIRFAECCRLVAAFALLLYAAGALCWLITNASFVIDQEVVALKQLQQSTQPAKQASEGATQAHVAEQNSKGASSGDVGKSSSALSTEIPIISGLVSVSVPPAAWLILCVVITVLVVLFVVSVWQKVIENWVAVRTCSWTSFLSILGCLWAIIWAVITTVIAVVITLLALIYVIYNIIAFVAAL